jgi:hypothetical protein
MLLNIEQFEYMPGPQEAAGLRILLHGQGDAPRAHSLGMAVPPGAHAFLPYSVSRVLYGSFLLRVYLSGHIHKHQIHYNINNQGHK